MEAFPVAIVKKNNKKIWENHDQERLLREGHMVAVVPNQVEEAPEAHAPLR